MNIFTEIFFQHAIKLSVLFNIDFSQFPTYSMKRYETDGTIY